MSVNTENKISKITRRDILQNLLREGVDVESAIRRFSDLKSLPSFDGRFSNMDGDFQQHRINNEDWDVDWFIDDRRLGLLEKSDAEFLSMLCFVIHPENLLETERRDSVLEIYNRKLRKDGFEIVPGKEVSGRAIYTGRERSFESEIQFYVKGFFEGVMIPPYVFLTKDGWDDYNYTTTFFADFYLTNDTAIRIGKVKILQEGSKSTRLPSEFKKLPDGYYSLFQGAEYYRRLADPKIDKYARGIKKGLNDVTSDPLLLEKARTTAGFSSSLIRFSEAYSLVQGGASTSFSFEFKKNGASPPVEFDFELNDALRFRMNVLIGKNGGGKTTMLSDIANAIVRADEEGYSFQTKPRPSFGKVITVSYSVFDAFEFPKKNEKVRYSYCGLRKDDGGVDINKLDLRLNSALKKVASKDGFGLWQNILKDLIGNDFSDPSEVRRAFPEMSSGQKLLITIFSEILANIEENSLVLFDEPETHLHPNMIFKLVKTLANLLETYNSFGILATHSPIILQQTPSKYVRVLKRIGGELRIDNLPIESFGENFSTITKEVFGDYEAGDVLYREAFDRLSSHASEDEILEMFENGLSLNAAVYLRAIYNGRTTGGK